MSTDTRGCRPFPASSPVANVFLIGGHSGAGKTVVARELARCLTMGLLLVDDLRMVLHRMTTREQQPAIHDLISAATTLDLPPERLRDHLIAAADVLSDGLQIVIAHHVHLGIPTIVEGDGLVPAVAVLGCYAGLEVHSSIPAVFLIEEDETAIRQNALDRGRGFELLTVEQQRTRAHADWLYGQWLKQQARAYNVPVVNPRPWATLVDRILCVVPIGDL